MNIFFGLGVTGRLGNQIIQYSIIRHLENLHGIKIYHSRWLGEKLFTVPEIRDSLSNIELHDIYVDDFSYQYDKILQLKTERMPEEDSRSKHKFINFGNSNLLISGQFDPVGKTIFHYPLVDLKYLKKHEHIIRSNLQFKSDYAEELYRIKNHLFRNNKLIVIHVRKGDFNLLVNPYYIFITKFYVQWLEQNFDVNSRLYVCGQPTKGIKSVLKKYDPLYLEDILELDITKKLNLPHIDIIIDHGLMRLADNVLISNSSFSFTACMLSENPHAAFFKPSLESDKLIKFEPWGSYTYDVCPFGWKFIFYYMKYRPWFGFAFIYQVVKMLLKGERIRDLSY